MGSKTIDKSLSRGRFETEKWKTQTHREKGNEKTEAEIGLMSVS